ncbi:MAG TPA: CAP domain-containing protein [Sulfurovum sp.]|nr:CAP domain-containing protein [Sulfurovum sp.]
MRKLFLFCCLSLSISSVFLEANSQREGLVYLNTIRERAGLITLKSNSVLQKAAASHAKYLIRHQNSGHYEKHGKEFYTGNTPSQRIVKAGYPSTFVMENISVNTPGDAEAVDNLFSAIYHRFVFLNLDKDEIGIGSASSGKKRSIKSAYVYNLSSSYISELCQRSFTMTNGVYYMKNICRQSSKMVPMSLFTEQKNDIERKNGDIILYPYPDQTNIWPAFYNEAPDPLPDYKVSGFPVSVQFNPVYYQSVRLKSFRLYDEIGNEIKEVRVLHFNNDPNHLLTELEFALMPLKRLEFGRRYSAVFEAVADGERIHQRWSFSTVKPEEPLYRITEKTTTLSVGSGTTAILYFVPNSKEDIVHSYRARESLKVSFLDQNTLKLTFPKRDSSGRIGLDVGQKKVFFDIR